MSTDPPLDYWTLATPMAAQGPARPLVTGPAPVGLFEMLAVVALALALAFAIVAALAWVLA